MTFFYLLCLATVGILTREQVLAFHFTQSHHSSHSQYHPISSTLQSSRASAVTKNNNAASDDESSRGNKKSKRVSLLVCPAQFCVPDDYQVLFDNLRKGEYLLQGKDTDDDTIDIEIGSTLVAPLPRTEWIKVAKQLPTKNFWDATLPVHKTLDWYFDAIEAGLSEILAKEGHDANICIIGHSIGGWVARAYLGGLSR
jgi:hypothetical protein